MPDVPAPDHLIPLDARKRDAAKQIPEKFREQFLSLRPIEIREVTPLDFFKPDVSSDANQIWFRVPGAAGTSPVMQHCMLAYASDMYLLGSALRPHGLTWLTPNLMTASLDHAMWFHAPVAFENWHLYVMDSPKAGSARGFNRGSIYTQNGDLVASTAQEGLMRPKAPKP